MNEDPSEYGLFFHSRPFTKILLVLFLMLASYLILFGLGILLASPLFNISVKEVIRVVENRELIGNIALLKYLQILYTGGLFLVPALLAGFLIHKRPLVYLKAHRGASAIIWILVILLMLVSVPWINFTGYLNEQLSLPERWSELMDKIRAEDEASWGLMRAYLEDQRISVLILNLLMIALVPAVGEELLFRGTIQRILQEWFRSPHWAVWITAILFSLAHYQFLGFLPRILLGAMFGYLFLWTGTVWIPVMAHLINNGAAVVYYYMYYNGNLNTNPESLGMESYAMWYMIGSVGISAMILAGIRMMSMNQIRDDDLVKRQ